MDASEYNDSSIKFNESEIMCCYHNKIGMRD